MDTFGVTQYSGICIIRIWFPGVPRKPNSRFANEFWSYRYRLELEWRNRKPNFGQIRECIEKGRKTAVWGCGKIGNQICEEILGVEKSNYLNVVLMIDSNELLKGRNFHGIRITAPECVADWKAFFIIVTVEREK